MARFTFSMVEEGFDDHINRSIRGYADLCSDVLKFSQYFAEDYVTIVDIGCSTGRMLREIKNQNDEFAPQCQYLGIELEEEFTKDLTNGNNIKYLGQDIRSLDWSENVKNLNLVISIFTLQFITKSDRQQIISRIYDSLLVGGGFIFAEKTLCEHAQTEEMMTFCYYDWKRQSFSAEQILDKETKLRHMMKPNTYTEVIDMVKAAGFSVIQPFWQNFHFAGLMAIKTS